MKSTQSGSQIRKPFSRPAFSKLLLAALAMGRLAALPATGAEAERPNIILCMTDDQGWGDVSYNGLTKIRTPNLDAMAAAGLRFDRFYAQPSCSPTRAGLMTGRHSNRMGVFFPGMPIRTQERTIAQILQKGGYRTGHFGKWHLNGVSGPGKVIKADDPCSPLRLGFDESFSVSNYFETDWTFSRNGVPEKTTGDGSEVIVAEALKFIRKAAADRQPFFAVVWFGSPHIPHKPLPADLAAAGGSGYYGELLAVDRSIGTLRSGLRQADLSDNTLLWFNSDNGGWLQAGKPNAHGTNKDLRGCKGQIWEGGIRVPCVIEWPAVIRKPAVTAVPAATLDIFPTLTEITGLKSDRPVPLDGVSLLPLIEGRMDRRPRPFGSWRFAGDAGKISSNSGPAAWIDNRYKLVKPKSGQWELYDLTEDRSESNDLAAREPEVLERMKAELEAWQQSVIRSFKGEDHSGTH
jgi:arylsulfatase A-like enzyme